MDVIQSASHIPGEESSQAMAIAPMGTAQQTGSSTRFDQNSIVFRLPIELIRTIFIDCADDYYRGDHGPSTGSVPSWVNVSYVCRRWRDIALNSQNLWGYVFFASQQWTMELLTRSRQAALKIHIVLPPIGQGHKPCMRFIDQLRDDAERIEELRIDLPKQYNPSIFDALSSCVPRLQSLKISVMDPSIPRALRSLPFNDDTTALRILEISGCIVPWHAFQDLSNLTILHLHDTSRENSVGILSVLRRMENLQHLYLDHALASSTHFLSIDALHEFQKVNLPRLSRLSITAPLSTIIAMLSCVNIPSETQVKLDSSEENESSHEDYAMLSSLMSQRFATQSHPMIRGLAIQSYGLSWMLRFSRSKRSGDHPSYMVDSVWGADAPFSLIINSGRQTADLERIICDMHLSLPLTNVQGIHFISFRFSTMFWKRMLRHFEEVRYFRLSQGDLPNLKMLSLIPALEELVLDSWQFSDSSSYYTLSSAASLQALYNALANRENSKGELTIRDYVLCRHGYRREEMLDMVGRWERGYFHIVEEHTRMCERRY